VRPSAPLFEFRHAGERFEALPALADELVQAKVDIIITASTPPAVAAKRATATIPIITISADPIGANLVTSLGQAPMSPDYSFPGRISARKAYNSFAMRCRISTRWPSCGTR
jgi:hypothetical protein